MAPCGRGASAGEEGRPPQGEATPRIPGSGCTRCCRCSQAAGGLDLGLHLTERYRHLACVEWDQAACRTLEGNRDAGLLGENDLKVVQADIAKLDPTKLLADVGLRPGELGLLVGGPPCQAFSVAGNRKGLDDPRGRLIWDCVHWVEAVRPKVFLCENVKGLLSVPLGPGMPKGSLFESLLGKLCLAGYTVDWFLVDAVSYGISQHRERVILIGNRDGLAARLPDPTHGPDRQPYRTFRDAVAGLNESSPLVMDFSPRKKRFLSLVPPGGNWRSLPPEAAREDMGPTGRPKGGSECGRHRRLAWDEPSPTILTSPNQTRTSLCHPEQDRALTLRECARVQGFPDSWPFCGSKEDQSRQVGNAVPVRLAEVLGNAVADMLDEIALDQKGNLGLIAPAPGGHRKGKVA